jgi:hypothetical protein
VSKGALVMKLRNTLAVTAMAVSLFSLGSASALAADYTVPSTGSGTLSNSIVLPGQAVLFCGSGFAPNSTVVITVSGRFYRSVTANSSGSVCSTVRVTSAGQHTLRARGLTSTGQVRVVSAMLLVRAGAVSGSGNEANASSGSGSDNLPFTGAEVGVMVAGATVLVGAGVGFRVAGRRRRTTAA